MPMPFVVEDDRFLRVVQVVLDPDVNEERVAAYTDFFAHDEPNFAGWCDKVRQQAGRFLSRPRCEWLKPRRNCGANLADACALIVEGLSIGAEELAAAPTLKAVQKYGVDLRRIDQEGLCRARRRRSHFASPREYRLRRTCAHSDAGADAARQTGLAGRISVKALSDLGYHYQPFDRRHTPNSNWGRVPGLKILYGSTIGIIGLGEISREFAQRAAAFGMRILYTQRRQAPAEIEKQYQATYRPMAQLLAESDWVVPFVPSVAETANLIGRAELAQIRPGARLVNISRANVVNRAALLEALKSGHLGGFGLDPLYESPGRDDDELLAFPNVVITPHIAAQPRFNALDDLEEMITGLARAVT